MKVIKLTTTTQASEVKKQSGVFQGIANSLDFTRSGIRVSESAGESVIGQKVPLLLSHDWEKPSIGSVTMTAVDKDGLHYEAKIYESAPDRELLLEGIENGTNFVSIGFGADGIDAEGNIDSIDLIELSLTSTPADPKATAQLVKQAIEDNKGGDMEDDKKSAVDPQDEPKATLDDVLKVVQDLKADFDKFAKDNGASNDDKKPADDKPIGDDKDAELQSLREVNAHLLSIAKKANSRDLTVRESSYLRKQSLAK